MKGKIRVAVDTYEFIELDAEGESADDLFETYRALKRLAVHKNGLPEKDFNRFIDRQLMGESNELEVYNQMSPEQVFAVQSLKKALKRLKAKEE